MKPIADETEHDVRGIMWGLHYPLFVPHWSREDLEALGMSIGRLNASTTIAVRINGVNFSISMSLEDVYFIYINILGSATSIVQLSVNYFDFWRKNGLKEKRNLCNSDQVEYVL